MMRMRMSAPFYRPACGNDRATGEFVQRVFM